MKNSLILILALFCTFTLPSFAEEDEKDKSPMNESTFAGLEWRNIGPALASGRIGDIAVHPDDPDLFYVAVASGHVWKTTNHGVTFQPVFDGQGSYSIGCVTIDPNNSHIVWVGTGENNSQRSVSYGDGVYKSTDAGKSWKMAGLENSEHIGKIIVHPENSNVVYVAAQGPLWGPGGDRGLYKTTDGGKTWEKSLYISENTGVSDIVMDPRDPDVIYATSYQRRRHVWTLINGGPESGIHKTTDGGENWEELKSGIPSVDKGRIGLAISPVNPDYIYAILEAQEGQSGFFRTTDRGASWEKRSDYVAASPQYYMEIVCDPKDIDKVYSLDTYSRYTLDGGKTWERLSLKERHVDDHALWVDPENTDHLIIGGDGGIYETYDLETWRFYTNLPVTQFYRIGVDNTEPFYHVYGGTQDNATIGGPVRTINAYGLMNQDFYFTKGGDGFQTRVDPVNPDIVYSQAQYGSLVRFDRKNGERTDIQPMPEKGEELRWNWDSPLVLSPHSPTRLYFAANKLFRSDNRGNSWKKISGDLTRNIDRNQLEVMGKIWPPEAVSKNASTSLYGTIVALAESPLKENLLYAGTDDGLIQITEDAGENWTKISKFTAVPETTYVSDIFASQHDENVVYATFNNHKMADFKPYVLKSTDKGNSWISISSNLPENGPALTFYEDHVDPNLLFVGTEYGLYFSNNGGEKWIKLKGGIPKAIAIKDMEIQKRENDLALASFGRGFYIMDDYTPLRHADEELLEQDAHIFPVKDALIYIPNTSKGRRALGEDFYRAENPFGAYFTYYLKEAPKTLKEKRKEREKELREEGKIPPYTSFEELRKEDLEEKPYLVFQIEDGFGNKVRRLKAPAKKGIHRLNWDLDYPALFPVDEKTKVNKASAYPVMPGDYKITMYMKDNGEMTKLAGPEPFKCKVLENSTLPPRDRQELVDFQQKMQKLGGAVYAADEFRKDITKRLAMIEKAILIAAEVDNGLLKKVRELSLDLADIAATIHGNESIAKRSGSQPPSIMDRLNRIVWYMWSNSSEPTETNKEQYRIIGEMFIPVLEGLRRISETEIPAIEDQLRRSNAPWTPGRLPDWKAE